MTLVHERLAAGSHAPSTDCGRPLFDLFLFLRLLFLQDKPVTRVEELLAPLLPQGS